MQDVVSVAGTRAEFRRVFGGVMVAMFLASIDQTILATALPAIGSALDGSAHLSWVVIAYLIATTVTAPLYGHLGDRFGRRRMLLAALALFTFASVLCAAAPTLVALVGTRALQGMGAGGLMALSQALIGEHIPPRERPRYQGYFASVFATSSTLGPVLGGYLTEHLSWRAVFAINLPIGALAAYLALRLPPSAPSATARFRPDVPGALLFAVAASALLLALTSASERHAWTSWSMFALLGAAVAGSAALLWWERRASDPVIPLRLLAMPAIMRSNAMVFCFAATLFGALLYLPLFLQRGRGFGIGESGLLLLPITLSIAVASTTTGALITATRRLTLFPVIGLALSSAAFAVLAATVGDAPTWLVLALTIAAALGLGAVMPVSQIIVQDSAGREALGSATASLAVSRSIGGAFGAGLAGTLLFGLIGHGLEQAFAAVFGALALLAAAGCALALSIPRRRL